ncbi:matrixin family metalloprotease [Sorangium sp. So ce1000]|uniref:matrixin family metalloprotease n=1 Tax=Sorangium sp. So ce1000 TaxID=3133325 RepID=UPI003F6268F3
MRRGNPARHAAGARRAARANAVAAACSALVAAALAHPGAALAYCRTSVCPPDKTTSGLAETAAVCTPALGTDCGTPLAWPSPCVSYSIQEDASAQVSLSQAEAIFEQAFATWTQADCGDGQTPRMEVIYLGPVACDAHEYNKRKANANIITFRDDGWPYVGGGNTLALTTVTYNLKTGEIYDADMEINSFDVALSQGDDDVSFDLLSIATHEAGHFLGLSHSIEREATMFTDYRPGTDDLRDLAQDDRDGICAVYPPGEPIKSCDPTPRHGFSSLCAADQAAAKTSSGCAAAPRGNAGQGGRGEGLVLAALALVGVAARARRGAAARADRERAR